ncbi:PF11888 family protein [Bacteroidetes bacterium oral taxon 272 str. F0290]|nr:PF11888 family protein [Bacteroidetes bacterium oral taxon 272 str. F0290]
MEKKTVSKEEMGNTIRKSFSMSQAESSSEQTVAEFRAKGMKNIQEQKQQETEHAIEQPTLSEPARNTENVTVQKRISVKMRKKTLEAYKQAYLVPTKLNNRKAVYLSRETQERADFIVRRLGDRGSNLSSFVENIVRQHLEEYGEDIEKWRRL